MKKDNRLLLLGVIGIITILCIILYNLDFEKPIETPSPTPTRTVSIPTSTLAPALTATLNPSPTVTNTVTPTETPKPTATPSAVPSPTAKVTHTSTPALVDWGEVEIDENLVRLEELQTRVKPWWQKYIERKYPGIVLPFRISLYE